MLASFTSLDSQGSVLSPQDPIHISKNLQEAVCLTDPGGYDNRFS